MNEVLFAQVSVYDEPRGKKYQQVSVCITPVSLSYENKCIYMLMYV